MDVDIDRIAGNRRGACRYLRYPGLSRRRADREVRNAGGAVAVPGACADRPRRRIDVGKVQICGAVNIVGNADGSAIAVETRWLVQLARLSIGKRNAG